MRSETEVKEALRGSKYNTFLRERYPKNPEQYHKKEWNPETGSCGFHARFTREALGVEEVGDETLVTQDVIPKIVEWLDKGEVLIFVHTYLEGDTMYELIRKDNRYTPHVFVLVKGGENYFMSQGFLHVYKHSVLSFTKEKLVKMLEEIVKGLSDFTKTKLWKDMDAEVYKQYFKADLAQDPATLYKRSRRVNGIGLFVFHTKPVHKKLE